MSDRDKHIKSRDIEGKTLERTFSEEMHMKQATYHLWIVTSLVLGYFGGSREAIAQIVPDGTLPINSTIESTVTPDGNTLTIDGGTATGGNLFHSFQDFNVPIDDIAHFNNALTIDNIITRVTGGNISNIDGLIRANGTANLFLINPAGLVFGENASLDLGGSFVGSTAEVLQFEDGSFYSAVDVDAPPLLTISVPVGLQFGPEPGDIVVRGHRHKLRFQEIELLSGQEQKRLARERRPSGLEVLSDQTLALVGGEISLIEGNLTAEGGRIELGSVAGNSTVTLAPIASGWQIGYEGVEQFGDISLSDASSLDTSGPGAGSVQVQGRSLFLRDGSAIVATTLGHENGEYITIRTTDSVEFVGKTRGRTLRSGILADVELGANGNGSTVNIETDHLQLIDGARVSVSTRSQGQGGDLNIAATESVDLMSAFNETNRFLAEVGPEATGNGGNITITSPRVRVRDEARISTQTQGVGRGGNLRIDAADSVEVGNRATLQTATSGRQSRGNAGDLIIETDRLILFERGSIGTATEGHGDAGNLTIEATESIELTDRSKIEATTGGTSSGDGGTIAVTTDLLTLRRGARIASTTIGEGDAGDLRVSAGTIDIQGVGLDGKGRTVPSRFEAQVNPRATGNAGDLTVRADRLTVRDGGRISAATFNSGNAGTLDITASQIELSGGQDFFDGLPAGLVVGVTENGSGDAGNLIIRADRLTVSDGMEVSVRSRGQGSAGSLTIDASELFLDRGILNAGTTLGNEGNITLNNVVDVRLRNGSEITAEAGNHSDGGNIALNSRTLVLDDSRINANAFEGRGGNVTITAQGIFTHTNSSIDASSQLGIDGTIILNTPDVDPSSGLLELPDSPIDVTALIGRDPCRHGDGSEFVNTGRGGLPTPPRESFRGESGWVQLVTLDTSADRTASDAIPQTQPTRLIEAQGWIIGENGEVILTANPPTVTPQGQSSVALNLTCQ